MTSTSARSPTAREITVTSGSLWGIAARTGHLRDRWSQAAALVTSAGGALAAGWISPDGERVASGLDDAGRMLNDMAARTEAVIARLRQSASELDELAAVMRRVEHDETATRSRLQSHQQRHAALESARRHHVDLDADTTALSIAKTIIDLERTLARLEHTRAHVTGQWDSACRRAAAAAGFCADTLDRAGRQDFLPPRLATGLPWAPAHLGRHGLWPPATAATTAGIAIEHSRPQPAAWPVDLPSSRTSPVAVTSWRSQHRPQAPHRADHHATPSQTKADLRHTPGSEGSEFTTLAAASVDSNVWSDRLATVLMRAWSNSTLVFSHHPVLGPKSRIVARSVGWMRPHLVAAMEFLWDWSAAVTLRGATIAMRQLTGPTTRHLLSPPRQVSSIGGIRTSTDDWALTRAPSDRVAQVSTAELDRRNRAALEASIGDLDERIARLEGLIDLLAIDHRSAFTAAHARLASRRTDLAAIITALDSAETDGPAIHLLTWSSTDPDRLVVAIGDPVEADRIDVLVPGTGAGAATLGGYVAAERLLASREARMTAGQTPITPSRNSGEAKTSTGDNRPSKDAGAPPRTNAVTEEASHGTHPRNPGDALAISRAPTLSESRDNSHAPGPHGAPRIAPASGIVDAPTDRAPVATIIFVDYPAPATVLIAAHPSAAMEGGSRLASMLHALHSDNPNARITLTGHSYGSTVVGAALQHEHAHVDAALLVASPGTLASSADQLASAGCVTAMTSASDIISAVAGAHATSALGPDPSSAPFGAKVLNIRPGWDLWHAYGGYAANKRSAAAIIATRNGSARC